MTSKGEPATEVLRAKLPEGIRELCVSLGSGDASSFRRLEKACETLASLKERLSQFYVWCFESCLS